MELMEVGKAEKPVFTEVENLDRSYTNESYMEKFQPSALFQDGKVVYMPAPTADPKDPLNMPMWRKFIAIGSLSFFGALAAAAEIILGAMLPVFDLEYSGTDPKVLLDITEGLPRGINPLYFLEILPHAPPVWKVYLLASLPVLMMGVANFFLVPLAIAVGRRPVLLFTGAVAIGGCIWAGFSSSLDTHIAARCIQALGAGTVESLLPFIIQDMVFLHQRNTSISGVFACQGVIIVTLGLGSPYIVGYLNWRWLYHITAIGAAFFLVCVFFFVPETKWHRTPAEMDGEPLYPLPPGKDRAELDFDRYGPRTFASDIALFKGRADWQEGLDSIKLTLKTFFYPHILFVTMLNSIMIATAFAAGYTAAPALLTAPWSWPFLRLGLSLFSVLIAAIMVYVITGWGADKFANYMAVNHGRREPEIQLLNLIIPSVIGIIGSVLFGLAADRMDDIPWIVFLIGLGFMAFGFLGANTIGAVYVLESFPHLAGPALVNIASFRCLIAFCLSFKVSDWVIQLGYLKSFSIYAGVMAFFTLWIPIIYVKGKAWRQRWPGHL